MKSIGGPSNVRLRRSHSAPPCAITTSQHAVMVPSCGPQRLAAASLNPMTVSMQALPAPRDPTHAILLLFNEIQRQNRQMNSLCKDAASINELLAKSMKSEDSDSNLQPALSECGLLCHKVQNLHDLLYRDERALSPSPVPKAEAPSPIFQQWDAVGHAGDYYLIKTLMSEQEKMEDDMAVLQKDVSMKEEHFQKEVEKLKKSQTQNLDNLMTNLQNEKDKNLLINEELEKMKALHQELMLKYLKVEQLATNLQRTLDMERLSHSDREQQDMKLQQSLRADKEALRQQLLEEMAKMEREATTKHESLCRETERLSEVQTLHKEHIENELQGEKDKNSLLSQELENLTFTNQELLLKYETAEQQVESLQRLLSAESKALTDKVQEDIKIFQSLRAEKEALRVKMAEDYASLQKQAAIELESVCRKLEEQKEINCLNQENFRTELQAERDRNVLLNQKLNTLSHSHQELNRRCEMVEQQATLLQEKLDMEMKSHAEKLKASQQLFQSWRTEKEALRQKMAKEMGDLQSDAIAKQESLLKEVEELKETLVFNEKNFKSELHNERVNNSLLSQKFEQISNSYQELSLKCQNFEQQVVHLQKLLEMEVKSHANRVKEDRQLLQSLRAEKETLRQQMSDEMAAMQKDSEMKQESLRREVDELTKAQIFCQENLIIGTQAETEENSPIGDKAEQISGSHRNYYRPDSVEQITTGYQDDESEKNILLETIQLEKEMLCQKMQEEMAALQRESDVKEKSLRREVEELRKAHVFIQERFMVELQAEKNKSLLIWEPGIRVSQQELSLRCVNVIQQAAHLQPKVSDEGKCLAEETENHALLFQSLKAETDALHEIITKEIVCLQRDAAIKQDSLLKELEKLKEAQIISQKTAEQQKLLLQQKDFQYQLMEEKMAVMQRDAIIKQETLCKKVEELKTQLDTLSDVESEQDLSTQNSCMTGMRHAFGLKKSKRLKNRQKQFD
ncbi:uncharacterized protein LOC128757425 [Synchiropus splendidus]|uniref:uncharacterized protein LOC128757425 n=1 Tax=Synchiropus splendidus TaxID=270530 RepID=UPI00237DBD4A|nr:uncharacterized protein LOC128757425 [Synchiropus splendidus]